MGFEFMVGTVLWDNVHYSIVDPVDQDLPPFTSGSQLGEVLHPDYNNPIHIYDILRLEYNEELLVHVKRQLQTRLEMTRVQALLVEKPAALFNVRTRIPPYVETLSVKIASFPERISASGENLRDWRFNLP